MNIIYRYNQIKKYFKIYNQNKILLSNFIIKFKDIKIYKKSKYKNFFKEENKRTKIN